MWWFLSLCWFAVAFGIVWTTRWPLTSSVKTEGPAGQGGTSRGPTPEDQDPREEGHAEEDHDSASFMEGVRLKKVKIEGATGEISRILASVDYYAVLEVERSAESAEIKKAYRTKQMATHPDKNQGVPGALEASQRVNLAHETLGDEIRRRQYDMRLTDEEKYGPRSNRRGGPRDLSELARTFDEFVRQNMPPPPAGALYPTLDPTAYDMWSDAPDHTFRIACTCGYDHIATRVQRRTGSKARLCTCSQCGVFGKWLPARTNDVWFESTSSIMHAISPERSIRAYRCVGNSVYDVTPWAHCNGLIIGPRGQTVPCNTHFILLRVQGNANASSTKNAQKRMEKQDASYGYNQLKGGGNDSHKQRQRTNNKKKNRR